MSDNPNLFDDDNLIPDWMRDMGLDDAPSPAGVPGDIDASKPVDASPAGDAVPPWQRSPGAEPPRPQGLTPAAPPWEVHPGDEAPPQARRVAAAPWDQAGEARESGEAPADEILPGMTADLPWREDATPPPEAPAASRGAEAAWPSFDALFDDTAEGTSPDASEDEIHDQLKGILPDEPLTMADMAGEFAQSEEEAPPPVQPSLRDRLLALSPDRGQTPPPAESGETPSEPLRAEEAGWLEAFGTAAEYRADEADFGGGDEDDLAWLAAGESSGEEPVAGPPAVAEPADGGMGEMSDEFDMDALFDDQAQPEDRGTEESPDDDDVEWLMDDLGDVPALRQPPEPEPEPEPQKEVPDWVRAAYAAQDEEETPDEAGEPDETQEEAVPDWLDVTLDEEPPKRRPSGIRRIGQAAQEDESPPDAGGQPPAWAYDAEETGPDESLRPPEGMTFEEWERVQAERARESQKSAGDRLLEAVPDWFQKIEGAPPDQQPVESGEPPKREGPEFVPGWFLGLEEQDEQETPGWLKNMDYSADALAQPLNAPEPPGPPAPDDAEPEVPDWFKGTETPDVPGVDWDALFGASQSEEPAAEPTGQPAAEEPVMPEFSAGELDEWPLEPDEQPEGIAPGQVPDWLAEAAPEGAPLEAEDLPLPDLDALMGEADFAAEAGEVPDWLAEAAPEAALGAAQDDVRAAPEDVPFPELDLDQTMLTEAVLDAALDAQAQAEEVPEDFVERFEPLEPEHFAEMPVPVEDEAPDWLREMASGEGEELPADFFGVEATSEPTYGADFDAMADDQLDWLDSISPEDVSAEEEEPAETGESITDLAFGDEDLFAADEAEERDQFETAPLDSRALDRLLGLYQPAEAEAPEPAEPVEERDALFDEAEAESEYDEEPAEEAGAFYEITGVPDPDAMRADEAMPDLDALFAEDQAGPGDEMPDLDALFDQAGPGMETPFSEGEEDLFAAGGAGVFTEAEQGEAPRRGRSVPEMPESPPVFRAPLKREPEEPPLAPAQERQPEWVDELRPSDVPVTVKAGGAEISVKQRQVTELPERLRAFREEAMRTLKQPSEPGAPSESGPLAGISGALPLLEDVDVAAAGTRPVEGLTITREQQARVARLQALLESVAAEEEEVEADRVVEVADSFALAGELAAAGAEPAPAAPKRARRRRFKPDRLLVAVLMLAALILPFVTDTVHFAADPPALAGDQQAVADVVQALAPGDYVLVALEYGPTAAGELDALARAVLRDTLARHAIPLLTSTVPAGAFHAEAVITPLAGDAALLAARGGEESTLKLGMDYVLLSYLPGETLGVRALRDVREDAGGLSLLPPFKYDLLGDETNLPITNLARDIALIVVVGDESGAVRTWAEQLEGVAVPKIALVTEAIEPLTAAYVNKDGYAGYLAGVRDTYSYNAARNADRAPYVMPGDLPVELPDPEGARWHSMALGAVGAAGLIALGMVVNLFRALTWRRRR